jgi:hypothetical protein
MPAPYIASLDLLAVRADGTPVPVALRIGAPERAAAGEWRCAVRLDGLHEGLIPMHGEDSVQALSLALRLAATLLRDFVARGGRLLYAPTTAEPAAAEWPLDAYFGWLGTPHAPAT